MTDLTGRVVGIDFGRRHGREAVVRLDVGDLFHLCRIVLDRAQGFVVRRLGVDRVDLRGGQRLEQRLETFDVDVAAVLLVE